MRASPVSCNGVFHMPTRPQNEDVLGSPIQAGLVHINGRNCVGGAVSVVPREPLHDDHRTMIGTVIRCRQPRCDSANQGRSIGNHGPNTRKELIHDSDQLVLRLGTLVRDRASHQSLPPIGGALRPPVNKKLLKFSNANNRHLGKRHSMPRPTGSKVQLLRVGLTTLRT